MQVPSSTHVCVRFANCYSVTTSRTSSCLQEHKVEDLCSGAQCSMVWGASVCYKHRDLGQEYDTIVTKKTRVAWHRRGWITACRCWYQTQHRSAWGLHIRKNSTCGAQCSRAWGFELAVTARAWEWKDYIWQNFKWKHHGDVLLMVLNAQ